MTLSEKRSNPHGRFSELLKVEWRLALREPTGLVSGVAVPAILLVVFGMIGNANPGNVPGTGYTVMELYLPVLMVIGFIFLGIYVLPNAMVRYREIGWLRRVSTSPAPPSRLLAAQLIINLALALATIVIVILGSELIFGASLNVNGPYFLISNVLSIAVIFSLGLVVAALVPSQSIANGASGGLVFLMLFLAGLWVPPATGGRAVGDDHVLFPLGRSGAGIA